MLGKQFIQILPQDTVAISISDCSAGTSVCWLCWCIWPSPRDVARCRKMPYAEQYNLANDLCLFNPAPITWARPMAPDGRARARPTF